MKILVPIKTIPDPEARIRVTSDGSGIETGDARPVVNPCDAVALEAALRLRETGWAATIIAVSVGPVSWREGLQTALAMGADQALLVASAGGEDPFQVAQWLEAVVRREGVGLVIAGRQGVDWDQQLTGPLLAGMLEWGQATQVIQLTMEPGAIVTTCLAEEGTLRMRTTLPAVVTVDPGLVTPRYASLPMIMAARRKPLQQVTPAELGVISMATPKVMAVREPSPRPAGILVRDGADLLDRLRRDGMIRS